jgi:hypothetical protein
MDQTPNLILSSLPTAVFALVKPHLKKVELVFGDVISRTDEPVSKVYFPHVGVVSLVVEMDVGDMIETAMVGRDGVSQRHLGSGWKGLPSPGNHPACGLCFDYRPRHSTFCRDAKLVAPCGFDQARTGPVVTSSTVGGVQCEPYSRSENVPLAVEDEGPQSK